MDHQWNTAGKLSRLLALAAVALVVLAVCAPSAFAILFTNGSFQDGDFTGWTKTQFLNTGLLGTPPFTGLDIVRGAGGADLTTIVSGASLSQSDANTGNVLHYPLSGPYGALINLGSSTTYGHGKNANSLSQQDVVTAADVDPVDGKVHVNFAWAAVVQNPAHLDTQQPYVYVVLSNADTGTQLYETFIFAGVGSIWQNAANSIQFTDWQVLDVPVDASQLPVGSHVRVEAVAAGCSLGGHWGYLYVDNFGSYWPATPHVTAADKYADGTTTAMITSRTLTGIASGDNVSLTGGTAVFDTAAVGNNKTVTATGLSLTGPDAWKYALTSLAPTTTANILAIGAPTVTTTVPSGITDSAAGAGGDVTADGGRAVTARGVCWSTSANPTTASSHTTDGAGTGTFVSSIPGLASNTTYHVRAYATNSQGTSYGSDLTFTTDCRVTFATDGTTGATLTGSTSQHVPAGGSATSVTANPPVGYHLVHWTFSSGGSGTSNPLTLDPVPGNIDVTAHFAIDTFTLNYAAGAHGSLSGTTPQTVAYGADATPVTAVPDVGYHFVSWSDGVLTATRTDTGVTGPIDATATFAIDTFTVGASVSGGHGSVSPLTQTVDYGADASIDISANVGYHIAAITVDGSPATIADPFVVGNVKAPHAVVVTFAIDTFTLSYAAGAHGSLSGTTPQTVAYGADATPVTAVPDAGYHFVSWSDGVTTATRTDADVTADRSVTATFAISLPPTTSVHGAPSRAVSHNVKLSLTAVPATDGAPVDYTEYRIGSGPWVRGTSLTIKTEGVTTIQYRSVSTDGMTEATRTCSVTIDRTRPKVIVGGEVNVNWGAVASFPYRLKDNLAKSLVCRLVITYHGNIAAVVRLGRRPVGRRLVAKMRCILPITGADAYGWRIEARDPAGNRGSAVGGEFEVWSHWLGSGSSQDQ